MVAFWLASLQRSKTGVGNSRYSSASKASDVPSHHQRVARRGRRRILSCFGFARVALDGHFKQGGFCRRRFDAKMKTFRILIPLRSIPVCEPHRRSKKDHHTNRRKTKDEERRHGSMGTPRLSALCRCSLNPFLDGGLHSRIGTWGIHPGQRRSRTCKRRPCRSAGIENRELEAPATIKSQAGHDEACPPRQTEMSTTGSKAISISGPANFNLVTTKRAPPDLKADLCTPVQGTS